MPGVNAAFSLGEAEGVSVVVLSEAAGGCVGADGSEPVLPQAANNIVREIAKQEIPVKHLFFIMNHLSFDFVSWVHSDLIGLQRIILSALDVMRISAGTFAAPMMPCYSIRRISCQRDVVIFHKIERICSYKIRYQQPWFSQRHSRNYSLLIRAA